MTQGLYDQIGAHRDSEAEALRAAYSRTVSRLARRRKDLLEQGGDTRQLDLLRAQVDEAWQVLKDPARRRRYDALLALTQGGGVPSAVEAWEQAAGVIVSPATAAGVEFLRALTRLGLPALAPVPGSGEPSRKAPETDTQADVLTETLPVPEAVARPMPEPSGHVLPSRPEAAPPSPSSAPVGVGMMAASGDPVQGWVAELGWSGALLRRVRDHRGLSLRDVGDATRISARYLEAIEADDHEHLPSKTFVKGYLREIARVLQLDETSLIDGYLRRIQ
jgi:hypothetical protein